MIIRTSRPTEAFTVVSNAIIENPRLSWKAKGVLIYLLSKPDHWTTSAARLAYAGPDGRDSIRAGLQELEEQGYVTRQRKQDARGRWTTQTMVYDTPRRPVDKQVAGSGQPCAELA